MSHAACSHQGTSVAKANLPANTHATHCPYHTHTTHCPPRACSAIKNCGLTGPIPAVFSRKTTLPSLTSLVLSNNTLSGGLPQVGPSRLSRPASSSAFT